MFQDHELEGNPCHFEVVDGDGDKIVLNYNEGVYNGMTWSANTLDRKKEVRESSRTSVHGYVYRRTTDGNFISIMSLHTRSTIVLFTL